MRLDPRLAVFLVAACADNHATPPDTDPDSVGTPLHSEILVHSKNDGDGQVGVAGQALRSPLLVRVTRNGANLPGVLVRWVSGVPGSGFNPPQGLSDANGLVMTSYLTGSRGSYQSLLATTDHDTLDYLIRAVPPDQTALPPQISRGDGPTQTADILLGVTVEDIFGDRLPNYAVRWLVLSGSGVLSDSVSNTGPSGEALMSLTLPMFPDTVEVVASSQTGPAFFYITFE